jgi:protein O-GlcNAc transferase
LNQGYAEAYANRGKSLNLLKRYEEASAAYDKALTIKPDSVEAWLGRGNIYAELKHYDEALAAYTKALSIKSDLENAWIGRGNALTELKRYDEALAAYDRALSLNPDSPGIESKLNVCDWSNFRSECEHLALGAKNNKANTDPFSLTAISESREDQLKCAKLWIGEKYRASSKPLWNGESYNHNRVRVGYVSADFRQHAVSYLIAGMFECHDKRQFEITAISIGPDDGSELRNRVKNAFDDFVDGSLLSDDEIAHQIKQKESDNLVDVNGFTRDARTGIFALRAAPIQVNYLGYPGTMGANYIDYIIADRTLVPQSHQQDYSEKIVYLPHCYQVNDAKRAISEKVFSREEMGLPRDGFVFCCFNNSFKSLPEVFDCWMRIVKKVQEAFRGSWKLMKPRLAI